MKWKFALILGFLISCHLVHADHDTLKIYSWEEARKLPPDEVTAIRLSKLKLEKIPEELSAYKNLIYLDLSKNKLAKLPDFIKDFKQLRSLNLYKNKFQYFPAELCGSLSLEKLNLGSNFIASLPGCIKYMEHLNYIDLSDNPIEELPNAFTEMPALKKIILRGIMFNGKRQDSWNQKLPWVKIDFDAPCHCMD